MSLLFKDNSAYVFQLMDSECPYEFDPDAYYKLKEVFKTLVTAEPVMFTTIAAIFEDWNKDIIRISMRAHGMDNEESELAITETISGIRDALDSDAKMILRHLKFSYIKENGLFENSPQFEFYKLGDD